MPEQSVFYEQQIGEKKVRVLKTYDQNFAREAFNSMPESARLELARALKIEAEIESEGLKVGAPEFDEYVWEELLDAAREGWKSFSYFVVTEGIGERTTPVFVSPDWPSAEAVAIRTVAASS